MSNFSVGDLVTITGVVSRIDHADPEFDLEIRPVGTYEDDYSFWTSAKLVKPVHVDTQQPAGSKDRARAVAGGLQAHSVGGGYPYHVVAIDHQLHGVWYVIQNLQTGEYEAGSPRGEVLRQWKIYSDAEDFADRLRYGFKGNPVKGNVGYFGGSHIKCLPDAAFRPMTPREAYYAAAEQDIG